MKTDPTRGPDEEELRRDRVIIAAALAAVLDAPVEIHRIRAVPGHNENAWLREGRAAIQESHRMAAPLIRLPSGCGVNL